MCHPGRPFPQRLGQYGSPGFDFFHCEADRQKTRVSQRSTA